MTQRPEWFSGQIIGLLEDAIEHQNKEEYADALYLAGGAYCLASCFDGDNDTDRVAKIAAKCIKTYCTDKLIDQKELSDFEDAKEVFLLEQDEGQNVK